MFSTATGQRHADMQVRCDPSLHHSRSASRNLQGEGSEAEGEDGAEAGSDLGGGAGEDRCLGGGGGWDGGGVLGWCDLGR